MKGNLKKIMVLAISLFSTNAFADFVVKLSDNEQYNIVDIVTDPNFGGSLIHLYAATSNASLINQDINERDSEEWDKFFKDTENIVINKVAPYNVDIKESGVVNWFDPNKVLGMEIRKGCAPNDLADSEVEFLDSNGNVVFWLKTEKYQSYSLTFTYGKGSDKSQGVVAEQIGPYPNVRGNLYFDKKKGTVSYKHGNEESTRIKDWVLSDVLVDDIRKIKLVSSHVVTKHVPNPTHCSAYIRIRALKEGEQSI